MTDVLDQQETIHRRRWRRGLWVVIAVLTVLAGFVLVWFEPQKLLIDERVSEPIPTVVPDGSASPASSSPATSIPQDLITAATATRPSSPAPPTTVPAPREPLELARGDFVSLDHGTSGRARVLQLADGQRFVRLEELSTENGPDLYVYLTTNPARGDEHAFDDEYVNLGRLKGNQGDQNYEVPAGADLGRLRTVVIWCDRFNSAFGAADFDGASAA